MKREISERSTVVAAKDQVSSNLGGEVAILDLTGGVYYGVDEVGARIWELIQKPIAVSQIQATVLEEYDVESPQGERDVLEFLQRLADEELLEVTHESSA